MARKSEVLASSIGHLLDMKLMKLQDIWDDVGIQEDKRLERMVSAKKCIEAIVSPSQASTSCWSYAMQNTQGKPLEEEKLTSILKELLDQMIHEEEIMKKQLEAAIKNWKGRLQALCSELLLDPYTAENCTPLQLEKELRNKVEALLEEKNCRMAECEMLLKEDQALCTDLCKTPYYIPTGKVPSLQELEELKNHLLDAAKEKECRLATFLGLRNDITILMTDIDHVPDTTFEKDAVLEEENLFFLSHENIKSLEMLRHQLTVKKQELLAAQESLKKQISSLWNTLQIPLDQQNICETGSIHQINTMLQLQLEQLQQMQTKNIKQIITRIRQELNTYWDKCFYSQDQREEFAFLSDENFTEELLKVHDEELVKITLHYQKCQELFVNVEKWVHWWKLFLELEKKASDPNRFSNRGGTLLKAEKERSMLQKKIPKLEEEIKLNIERWETEHGCPFLIYGQKFSNYVANQWEQHRFKKVQEKQERCVKKEDGFGYKTPLKRTLGASGTPQSKIRKLNGSSNFTLNSGGRTCKRTRKPSPAAQKTTNVPNLPGLPQETNASSISQQPNPLRCLTVSYSEFARDFTRKSNISGQLNSTTVENP